VVIAGIEKIVIYITTTLWYVMYYRDLLMPPAGEAATGTWRNVVKKVNTGGAKRQRIG
jgi:hypothetical protein